MLKFYRFFLGLYFFSIHFEMWDPLNTGVDYLITKITTTIYIVFSFFIILINRQLKNRISLSLNEHKFFLINIALIFLIPTFLDLANSQSFNLIHFLNTLVFFLILIHDKIDKGAIRYGINSFIFGGCFLLLFIVLGVETDYSWPGRLSIFGVNQNLIGINICIIILIILSHFFTKKSILNKNKYFLITLIPFFIIVLASTGSRTAVFTLLFGGIIYFLFKNSRSTFLRLFTILFGAIFVQIIFSFFLNDSVIGQRISDSIIEGDLSGREIYWEKLFILTNDLTKFEYIFGIGYKGFNNFTYMNFEDSINAHNVFIQSFFEGGLVSLILLIMLCFYIIKKSFLNYRMFSNPFFLVLLVPIFALMFTGQVFGVKIIYGLFALILTTNTSSTKYAQKN